MNTAGKPLSITLWVALIIILCASQGTAVSLEVPTMTKEELKANLNKEDFVIIDVRTPNDYDKSGHKISGAIRENPMDVRYWAPYPKDKTIVLYCA